MPFGLAAEGNFLPLWEHEKVVITFPFENLNKLDILDAHVENGLFDELNFRGLHFELLKAIPRKYDYALDIDSPSNNLTLRVAEGQFCI